MSDELTQLREENEKLKQMNTVKSNWISIAAHQLRTSLSAVKWILKMMIDHDFGELNAEQNGFIKKAFESNERMIKLVSEMLSLNHMTETGLTFHFEPNDLVKLIDETIFEFTGESFKNHIEVIFLRPTESVPLIPFDLEKIRVVLENLIENAIKYSDEKTRVVISMRTNEHDIEVSVKDTGIGIPKEQSSSIFQKAFRATNAKEKEVVGSGFGLYTTKHIVEKHDGKMWFESELGVGSTFYFTLPLSRG